MAGFSKISLLLLITLQLRSTIAWWQYNALMTYGGTAEEVTTVLPRIDQLNQCRNTGFTRHQFPIEASAVWNVPDSFQVQTIAFYRTPDCKLPGSVEVPELIVYLNPEDYMGLNIIDFKALGEGLTPVSFQGISREEYRARILQDFGEEPASGKIYGWKTGRKWKSTIESVVRNVEIEDYAAAREIAEAKTPETVAKLLARVTEEVLNENPNREREILTVSDILKQIPKITEKRRKYSAKASSNTKKEENAKRKLNQEVLQKAVKDVRDDVRKVYENTRRIETENDQKVLLQEFKTDKEQGFDLNSIFARRLNQVRLRPLAMEVPIPRFDEDAIVKAAVVSGDPKNWFRDLYAKKVNYDRFLEIAEHAVLKVLQDQALNNKDVIEEARRLQKEGNVRNIYGKWEIPSLTYPSALLSNAYTNNPYIQPQQNFGQPFPVPSSQTTTLFPPIPVNPPNGQGLQQNTQEASQNPLPPDLSKPLDSQFDMAPPQSRNPQRGSWQRQLAEEFNVDPLEIFKSDREIDAFFKEPEIVSSYGLENNLFGTPQREARSQADPSLPNTPYRNLEPNVENTIQGAENEPDFDINPQFDRLFHPAPQKKIKKEEE